MSVLDDAVARYQKILDGPAFKNGNWIQAVQDKGASLKLLPDGRPVCPVLRPHLISRKQFDAIAKAAELLYAAMERLSGLAMASPALLNRLAMVPAERMLAAADPRYPQLAVTCLLQARTSGLGFRFADSDTTNGIGLAYGEPLGAAFFDAPPVKEWRKKYKLTRTGSQKKLLQSVLSAYKGSGKKKFPRIAIVETRPPFKNNPAPGNELLAEYFRQSGYPTEVVTPDQLDYRGGSLCRGDFGIEIVYRRISAQEFLFRFELAHPLVRAYRDGAICMVNSFRAEILQKRAMLALLTDDLVVSKFPAAERKAIRDHVPWSRVVANAKTIDPKGTSVDLPEYILANRDKLVLLPNDNATDMHSYRGWETGEAAWNRALTTALRSPYVVQQRVQSARALFPLWQPGKMEMKELEVDVTPHLLAGKVDGCTAAVRDATSSFSTLSGLAPAFILEGGR
jgi:hypothetical protein